MAATPIPLVMAESIEAEHAKGGDAASKLAADVNAAAEALDNLKRSLRRQFPDPVLVRVQSAPPYLEAGPTRENQPWQSAPMMSANALPQVPATSLLPADLVHATGPRRFDILGFLAGVALSAAIGAVVYIYFAAG